MAAFPTVADFELFVGDTGTDESRVQQMLDMAAALIRSYTGQTFDVVANDVVTVEGGWSSRLYLPQVPVTAVASVVSDGTTLTVTTDYTWTSAGMLTRADDAWWKYGYGSVPIVVTYTHGYATPPGDVKAVCLSLVQRMLESPQGVGAVDKSESIGTYSYSVSYGTDSSGVFVPSERAVLDHYRFVYVS